METLPSLASLFIIKILFSIHVEWMQVFTSVLYIGPVILILVQIGKCIIQSLTLSFISLYIVSSGHIERRYVEVPHGASWAHVTMKSSGFDTPRKFYVDAIQVKFAAWKLCLIMGSFFTCFLFQMCPLQRPLKWEKAVTFASSGAKSFAFRVISGQTLEIVIAQFWSSGIGSHETASVNFEVTIIIMINHLMIVPIRLLYQ